VSIAATRRRWRHPSYRQAYRGDLPIARDWIIVTLIMLVMSFAGLTDDATRLCTRALDAIGATERVANCINGQTTLGGEFQAPDGSTWVALCAKYESRVRS